MLASLGACAATVEVGTAYVDPGATAHDNYDGDLTGRIITNNPVNTAKLGTYTVSYSATDKSGNTSTVTREVQVVDTTAPVIQLAGDAHVTINLDATYVDAGATAQDNYDGDLTASLVVKNSVRTSKAGQYTVTYDVTDSSKNVAPQVVRTVSVVDPSPASAPEITLLGNDYVKVRLGLTFNDQGATAYDREDGDITGQIAVEGKVNTWWPGLYTLKYSVKDSDGNEATPVTRQVRVTFFLKGEGDSDALLIASPLDGSTQFAAAGSSSALVTLTLDAPPDTESVDYEVDGVPVGSATDAPFAVAAAVSGWGSHHVKASAHLATHSSPGVAESTFTLSPAPNADDADANGYADNPFATLAREGDVWTNSVVVTETGATRSVGMARLEGVEEDSGTMPLVLVLDNPAGPGQVLVSVPRVLLGSRESGIVMVTVAGDLPTLLGIDEGARMLPEPEGLVLATGGAYVDVSVLTSPDNGVTFDEVDNARVARYPVHVAVSGLASASPLLYTHPSYVDSDAATGIAVVAEDGAWDTADIVNVLVKTTDVSADLTSLSVLAPYVNGVKAGSAGCNGNASTIPLAGYCGDLFILACSVLVLSVSGKRRAIAVQRTGNRL